MGGKRQQRITSYRAQGILDFQKHKKRKLRWSKPCSEEAAYMEGFSHAKYGFWKILGRHKYR